MAFDGITTAAVVKELSDALTDGGISRIIQSEKDELQLLIKNQKKTYYLVLSANASLPLIYLADGKKEAPITAPNFCMLLRKHIQGGRIVSITQPGLERIVILRIEHRDELGDPRQKKLILELMGKYSNLIFTDETDTIIDSIRRVPSSMSSVREVLPGRHWFITAQRGRTDPLKCAVSDRTGQDEAVRIFTARMEETAAGITKALTEAFTGIAPVQAEEFAYEADADPRMSWADLDQDTRGRLAEAFVRGMTDVKNGVFRPAIVAENGVPKEFGVLPLRMYAHEGFSMRTEDSVSRMLLDYYGAKEQVTRMRQKSADLRHLASTALERVNKKFILQQKQMKSTEKKDRYRIYGEMLNTYGYGAKEGDRELTCTNYYTGEPVTVPLDPTMTVSGNAQHYFARYNKLKRTEEAMKDQLEETAGDREQLESILTAIDLAESEADLSEIRRELSDYGFIHSRSSSSKGAKRAAKAAPYAYVSSDGFEMLVGRNNYQNEDLTFRTANGNDWWFHAKNAPGSHVIVRCGGREVPDRTFEEAGALAAWYSSKRNAPKVEVDYTRRKQLKKKNGGKPGFVIYHTNYSLMAVPDISGIRRADRV